jgi:hypothetical protein
MEIDRRAFIASIGGAAAVAGMSDEAKAGNNGFKAEKKVGTSTVVEPATKLHAAAIK